MQTIRVQFEVPHDKLPMILNLLAGEVSNIATKDMAEVAAARLARITPAAPPVPIEAPKFQRQHVKRPSRMMTHAVEALTARGFKPGQELPYSVIEDILEAGGFARTSCHPTITMLVRAGYVSRIGGHVVRVLAQVQA
jgi:hypothetical protein